MFDRAAARLTFGISEFQFGFVVLFGCSVLFIAAVTNREYVRFDCDGFCFGAHVPWAFNF